MSYFNWLKKPFMRKELEEFTTLDEIKRLSEGVTIQQFAKYNTVSYSIQSMGANISEVNYRLREIRQEYDNTGYFIHRDTTPVRALNFFTKDYRFVDDISIEIAALVDNIQRTQKLLEGSDDSSITVMNTLSQIDEMVTGILSLFVVVNK